jgi:hypothetical protein
VEVVESPFFFSDALVHFEEQRALFSHRDALIQVSADSRQTDPESLEYEPYAQINLACVFYDPSISLTVPVYETSDCEFTTGVLDEVLIYLPNNTFRRSTYRLQLSLGNEIVSKIFDNNQLKVLTAPRLHHVYP